MNPGARPQRPPRPATLYIDPEIETYQDVQHMDFLVENSSDAREIPHADHRPSLGTLTRDSLETTSGIPASVRSFSNNLGGGIAFNPFLDRNSSTEDLNAPRSDPFTGPRRRLLTPDSPIPPSPLTPTYEGEWPGGKSRDAMASPPLYSLSPTDTAVNSPNGSQQTLVRKCSVRRGKSNALDDTGPIDKPWLKEKDMRANISYWLSWSMMLFCAGASALMCMVNIRNMQQVGNLCLVLDDDFSNGLDRNVWFHEVDMGGFGNKEFEMTTNSENNTFVEDGILYIVPTLTSDVIGELAIFDGYTYNITGCTNANLTTCSATSNSTLRTVINPVQSARITTKHSHSIQYGRVEIRARLPRGDWLWPALWMLPTDSEYGAWPVSGEIDIMESRGNGPEYPFQGRRFVRSTLNWGPVDFIDMAAETFGWWTRRRMDFSDDFHTFVLEWTPEFLRCYVDTRLNMVFNIEFNEPFYKRGNFPATAQNGTQEVILNDPWAISGSNSAPFDKPFYLIMNVAVGGRNGWFPDTLGNKMWYDGSEDAMYDFAMAKDVWYSTWPKDPKRRGMAIDHVKMWQKC